MRENAKKFYEALFDRYGFDVSRHNFCLSCNISRRNNFSNDPPRVFRPQVELVYLAYVHEVDLKALTMLIPRLREQSNSRPDLILLDLLQRDRCNYKGKTCIRSRDDILPALEALYP